MANTEVSMSVEESVLEKFHIALSLTKESEDCALEKCLRWYIAKSFDDASKEIRTGETSKIAIMTEADDFTGKANRRIPVWATRTDQYNHKIIRAYFFAENEGDYVTLRKLEELCSDEAVPEMYVPTFKNNYAQMKIDGAKSHGKVFEDDGTKVWVWDGVAATLEQYRDYFEEGINWKGDRAMLVSTEKLLLERGCARE